MAVPCSSSLSFQSDWIVFSAPEMTTVSNPNRNPARDDVTDQKIRRRDMGVACPRGRGPVRPSVPRCDRGPQAGRAEIRPAWNPRPHTLSGVVEDADNNG